MIKRPPLALIIKWSIVAIMGLLLSLAFGNGTFYFSVLHGSILNKSLQTILDQEFISIFILCLSFAIASLIGLILFPQSIGITIREFWIVSLIGLRRLLLYLVTYTLGLVHLRPMLIFVVFARMATIVFLAGPLLYQILLSTFRSQGSDRLFIELLFLFVIADVIAVLYQGLEATIIGGLFNASALIVVCLLMVAVVQSSLSYTALLHKISIKGSFIIIDFIFRYLIVYYWTAMLTGLLWFLLRERLNSDGTALSLFYLPRWLRCPQFRYLGLYLSLLLLVFSTLLWAIISSNKLLFTFLCITLTVIALGLETGRLIFQRYRQIRESFAGIQPYLSVMIRPLVAFMGSYFVIIAWFAVVFYQFNRLNWGHFDKSFSTFWESLNYSMLTITTLGFDQFKPVDPLMQALTTLEAIVGTAWLVFVFAALTSYLGPYFAKIDQRRKMDPVLVESGGTTRTCIRAATLVVCKGGQGDFASIGDAIQSIRHTTKDIRTRIEVRSGHYVEPESLVIDKPIDIVGVGSRINVSVEAIGGPCVVMAMDGDASLVGLSLRGRISNGNVYPTIDIRAGTLLVSDCNITAQSLACIAIHGQSTNPTIQRCTIRGGSTGILVDNYGLGTLKNCIILSSGQIGLEIARGSNPSITNCQISDRMFGIVVGDNGLGIINGCYIYGNTFGIEIRARGKPEIVGCRVFKQLRHGVNIKSDGQGTFMDCRVYDNRQNGFTIEDRGEPSINDCDIYRNGNAGVMVQRGAAGHFTNNRLYANRNSPWRTANPNAISYIGNEPDP